MSVPIAIVGFAGRFPEADSLDEYWRNIIAGRDCIRRLSDSDLIAAGIPADDLNNANYVKSAPVLRDADYFDAAFFRFSPKEAAWMDPQQRVFLECAWEALEHAGYAAGDPQRRIGVFAGAGANVASYFMHYAGHFAEGAGQAGGLQNLASDKDYLTTRVSFKLGLRGPSMDIQTACSSSLVAVHVARLNLLAGECDMALAGGVSVRVPLLAGYRRVPGGITSSDGRCRVFDERADGTVFGSGAGIVVLKRLPDAEADGDRIYAVLRGTAVNNDGARKASYAAPSVEGQAEAIGLALKAAGLPPSAIHYIEMHGTGTTVGDPIEVAAFRQALGDDGSRSEPCYVGSVKASVGHLDAASGIAGLLKAVLIVRNREIPPIPDLGTMNPRIDLEGSCLVFPRVAQPWRGRGPMRACVNSLGIGGTNAHAIVEEWIEEKSSGFPARDADTLVLSAPTETALRALAQRYVEYLAGPGMKERRCDIAYTAATGRVQFAYKLAVKGPDWREALLAGSTRVSELPIDPPASWQGCRRVPLPTYPFERQRYWFESAQPKDGILYESVWRKLERPAPASPPAAWLVVLGRGSGEWEARLIHDLETRGTPVRTTHASDTFEHILDLLPSNLGIAWIAGHADRELKECSLLFSFVRSLLRSGLRAHLQVVTRQNWSLTGFVRVLANEHPEFGVARIEREASTVPHEVAQELRAAAAHRETEIELRPEGRFVRRLVRASLPTEPDPVPIRPDAAYVIAGGSGGLGRETAAWLVNQGARHLILLQRQEADAEFIAGLRSAGANVTVERLDLMDAAAVYGVFEKCRRNGVHVAGVVHAAGTMEQGLIGAIEPDQLPRVCRVRVEGAWNLHEASLLHQPDFFVLYSSLAATLGIVGLSSYAAGHAFLDGLAEYRRANGLPGQSVQWSAWEGVGLGRLIGLKETDQFKTHGGEHLDRAEALGVLRPLLNFRKSVVAAFRMKWDKLAAQYPTGAAPRFLMELLPAVDTPRAARAEGSAVLRQLCETLEWPAGDLLPLDRPLTELGLDSMLAIDLGNRLGRLLGRSLPATLLFNYPTARALMAHLEAPKAPVEPIETEAVEQLRVRLERLVAREWR